MSTPSTTAIRPVRQAIPPRANPPAPVFAVTSSATANAALSSLDATIAPFREMPPKEEGVAGVVAAVVGGALGVVNAPATFIDHSVSAGVSGVLDYFGVKCPAFPVAQIGITFHMGTPHVHAHPPSTIIPAPPIPLPSFGVAFLAGSASVLVNGIPALRAGDVGIGFTCGSLAPPFEIVTGASSVYFAGSRVARIGIDMTMHCNPAKPMGAFAKAMGIAGAVAGAAGAAAQLSAGNPTAALAQAAQVALDAGAMALALLRGKDPGGPPGLGMLIGVPTNVQAGGPPIPNIGAWAQGHLFKGIGKLARSLKGGSKRCSPTTDAKGGVKKGPRARGPDHR